MKKKLLFTVCFVVLSFLAFLQIGGGKSFAMPFSADLTPLKLFLIDGKLDGPTDNSVEVTVQRLVGTASMGTLVYLDNSTWKPLISGTSFPGGTWLYLGLSTIGDNTPEIVGTTAEFSNPISPGSTYSENPTVNFDYYRSVNLPWLPPLFLAALDSLGTVNPLDGYSNVPIPGSAIVLVSLLGGFFALGKRKKRETV